MIKPVKTVKYRILKKPLALAKTRDFCVSKQPKLTVIMLHGVASNSHTYDKTFSYFEDNYKLRDIRFVTFDWLGCGKSYSSKKLEYTIDEELTALENSIQKLKVKTPIILIGHSMGCILLAHYAKISRQKISKMILISPPIYTKEEIKDPLFKTAIDNFRTAVKNHHKKALKTKAFPCMIKNIVERTENYKAFTSIKVPTMLICGDKDQFLSEKTIKTAAKDNKKYFKVIKTIGRHSVSRDKYTALFDILKGEL